MALLLVRVENTASLPLNEFYDYNGKCYGLSCSRRQTEGLCLDMEDFYEATVGTEVLHHIPVVFISDKEGKVRILGWYREAEIYRQSLRPSFFLEGNLLADAADVCLLPPGAKEAGALSAMLWNNPRRFYEVIEAEDTRYDRLLRLIRGYRGDNAFLRYPYLRLSFDSKALKNHALCIEKCRELSAALMADQCRDIRDIRALEYYAHQAAALKRDDPDGFYYHAMACYQLGFLRQGLKSIGKALELEPGAPDLLAQKAFLLASRGYVPEAASAFRQSYAASGEEDYLLWEGKTWLLSGQADKAYACFRSISDQKLLEEAGIRLKDMEHRWPFMSLRGLKLGNLFRKS